MNDHSLAIQRLEQACAGAPANAASHYRLGILLLNEFLRTGNPEFPRRAREHLARAATRRPTHAASHAALGYACDHIEGLGEEALAQFREACRLRPQDKVCEVYWLTLLGETGREDEALAGLEHAASRHRARLPELRQELTAAGMPTDARTLLANGFIHARNFFGARLAREAERILRAIEPRRARAGAGEDHARCLAVQQQLERSLDASVVPEPVRALSAWAFRHGLGDDHCRVLLLRRLPGREMKVLVRAVDLHAAAIHAWLDSLDGASMPPEAAAFMYLALGVEETRN